MSRPDVPAANLITREDSVLVVIDVQEKLMPIIANTDRVLENVVRLLRLSLIHI